MREILFKAKRIDNDEWVEGYYCRYGFSGKEKHYIIPSYASDLYAYEIDINTLCQYTGLHDKNKNKIWENDVVKFEDCEMSTESGYGDWFVNVGHIFYDTDSMSYYITDRITIDMEDMDIKNDIEVIGNIFDNPELIKGCD